MTKVKYDVRDSDPDVAEQISGTFESPKPGLYYGKVLEANPKGAQGDPNKPMLEVVFELAGAEKDENKRFAKQRSRLWYYLLLPGHPSYDGFVVQKLDQFLLAAGVATKKGKRTGTFDTDDLIGMEIGIVVRAGKDRDGNYRGEVGSVFVYDEDTFGQTLDNDDDESDFPEIEAEEEDEEDESEADDEEEEEEEEGEDEEEVAPYEEWSIAELREELANRDLNSKGNKAALIERLEADDEEGEEEEEEGEEEAESDEDFPFA